jgi:tetratricopeptide (TPR) repeat protein
MFVASKIEPPFTSGPVWERVYALDTTFTYALFRAARFLRPSNALRSDSILKRLDGKREQLPQPLVFLLDAMLAEFAENRTGKYEALKRAAALAPARFLTDFASSAIELYRPRETLQLLDRLVEVRPDYRDSARYVSWRIGLYHQLGEHRRETVLARKALRGRPGQLSAIYDYARALAATHRTAEVSALVDSALSAPRDDYFTPGSIMWIASEELRAHGEPDAAAAVARRMMEWYESSRATEADTSWHSNNLAFAYYTNGRWGEAKAIYEQIIVAQPSARAYTYGYLGGIAARSNDRNGALRYIVMLDSLDVPAEGPRYEALISRARISALLGDDAGALRALREAVGGQGMDLHADADFASLRNDPAFREFCRPKP